MMIKKIHRNILFVALIILMPNQSLAKDAPIIQPGAPGWIIGALSAKD